MATTAEVHGIGARAPNAQPRASEYDMKERVRLSGLFPRMRNEPMSTQLQAVMKDFEKNAALTGILERRRRLEERIQYEMRSREAVAAANVNLAPPFRTGTASFATSAAVANKLAAPDAADVMTGNTGASSNAKLTSSMRKKAAAAEKAAAAKAGKAKARAPVVVPTTQEGGSTGSTDPAPAAVVQTTAPKGKTKKESKKDKGRSPSTSRQRVV